MWFPDGRRVLINGTRSGQNIRSYIQAVDGGAPRELTPENIWATSISPDGEWVATVGTDQGTSLWPVAGGDPRPVLSSEPGDRAVAWTADGRRLWIFRRGQVPAEVLQLEIVTGERRLWKTLSPADATGVYSINDFKVTRDGRAYFYSYKRVLSQLYVVSGLK